MNKYKKLPKWRKQTVSAMLALTLLIPAASPVFAADAKSAAADRIAEVLDTLEKNHVSGPKADKLSETGIRAMVESLGDPYTQYFTAEQLQSFEDAVQNQYVGIGVRVGMEEEGVYVADVFAGSPAKEAGMLRGDIIVKVGDEKAAGKKIDEVTSKILGPVDTEVRLQVLRDGHERIDRQTEKVQIPTVVAKRVPKRSGYINAQASPCRAASGRAAARQRRSRR
ncbi:S41 family peptidase [Paenibacillus elgii]|uniref:S41 family peptidase n=1 Tax=Paenibacillus elgii TaxID=189691 RepID=UPI0013D447E3|nr:PDZ domain-containing protein [Paenibacillus elgii]